MKPAEIWSLSPAQIVRYARNAGKFMKADHEHDLTIAWINASLQRSKKMPSLRKLLSPTMRRPTLHDIVGRLETTK